MITILMSFSALSAYALDWRVSESRGQDRILIQRAPIDDCPNGDAVIATFPFGSPGFKEKYSIQVFGPELLTLDQIKRKIEAKGLRPMAIFNGGFFSEGTPLSYFKSFANHNEHPSNSARGPRACMLYETLEGKFNLLQSTEANYKVFTTTEQTEIFCAGPQILAAGQNVTARQYCAEQFSPECRPDHTDPGLEFDRSYPRTASCYTRDGSFKVFTFSSPTRKCGLKGNLIADAMLKQGCVDGINFDGGGSTKLFLTNGSELIIRKSVEDRAVPIWIAVVTK